MALRIENSRFVKVWEVKNGKFGKEFTLGTSRKHKEGNYKNSNWWNCKFVGKAKDFGDTLQKGDLVKIISGQLENVYNKETQKAYFNLVIFEAQHEGEKSVAATPSEEQPAADLTEDFPF